MKKRGLIKNRFLFKAISESIDLYGVDGLRFILLNHDNPNSEYNRAEVINPSEINDLFTEIDKAVKKHGIDHIIYLIQNKNNLLPDYCNDLRHTKKLNDKVFEVVCNVFETDKESVQATERNGKRIYASGTIIKIFNEILDYSLDDIKKLIPKSKPVISKHKILVSNLDYKHPQESDALKKYLFCKHQIINFILNQENGKTN